MPSGLVDLLPPAPRRHAGKGRPSTLAVLTRVHERPARRGIDLHIGIGLRREAEHPARSGRHQLDEPVQREAAGGDSRQHEGQGGLQAGHAIGRGAALFLGAGVRCVVALGRSVG